MSDKEILDEIETSWMSKGHLVKIDREHFDWLIKQIKILHQEKEKYKQDIVPYRKWLNTNLKEKREMKEQLQQLIEKIKRYEKVLKEIKNDIETDYKQEEIALGEMTSLLTVIYEQVQQALEGSE